MEPQETRTVQMIPVRQVHILNPRVRNRKIFEGIVSNISHIGLKRPITVSKRRDNKGAIRYDLVCGQGRLEAYLALGQTEIPAIVIDANEQDCLVMSLVENLARRQHSPIEHLHSIRSLKKRGYSFADIAAKTDLTVEYVRGVIRLLDKGEIRLLSAVESGTLPLHIAIKIAVSDDAEIQAALQKAYEDEGLRGKKLTAIKRLIEKHRQGRKVNQKGPNSKRSQGLSSQALIRAYRQEADRQRLMVKKADIIQGRLLFVVEAFSKLAADENFVTLLRAETLDDMPKVLAERITGRGLP